MNAAAPLFLNKLPFIWVIPDMPVEDGRDPMKSNRWKART